METPTAAMKIFWSWSQQPCSSQFTATILAHRRRRCCRSASGSNSGVRGGETGRGRDTTRERERQQNGNRNCSWGSGLVELKTCGAQEPRPGGAGRGVEWGPCPRRVWYGVG